MSVVSWVRQKLDKPKVDVRSYNTDKENELLDQAQERWQIAKSAKVDYNGRDLRQKWEELDNFYRGQQWLEPVPEEKSTPVVNFTFSLIEAIVPRISDMAPEILVLPRSGGDNSRLAEHLTKVHKYLWYINRMDNLITMGNRICLKYGTNIYKVIWDPSRHDGLGEVKYSIVHPFNFFPDPRATDIHEMDYCFTAIPRSLEYLMRRWPEKAELLHYDNDWQELERQHADTQELQGTLKEYWFRDEDGNLCVMYYVGDVVFDVIGSKYDGSNEPVYQHNQFPFARQVDYELDKQFWGIGEIEIIQPLQKLINNLEAQIIDNTRLTANNQWLVNKRQSGLTEEDAWVLTNTPGDVIFTMDGGVQRIQGAPIPPHIPQHQERLIFAAEQILGIHDVVQGRKPSGVRAASAIIALQEAANVRVRQKARNLEHTLRELASLANWLVLEFYNEPRRIRIGGESPPVSLNVREALEQYVTHTAGELGLIPPGMTPDDLPEEHLEQLMGEIKFPEFDVEVKAGPSVPYSQALLHQQALEFYQAGIIDRKAVLDTVNFPGREEILARIEGGEAVQQGERVGERTFARMGPNMGRPPTGQF